MDIFQTTVTAGELLYEFISSCAEFSSDAKSLSARFEWDLRLLKQFIDFFNQREAANGGKLSKDDQELLNKSVSYLGNLIDEIQSKRRKIEAKGWLRIQINRARWIYYKSELKGLEAELFEWTRRLDLRLVAFPPELNCIDPHEKYLRMSEVDKTKLQDSLAIVDQSKAIEYFQAYGRRVAAKFKQRNVIVEYKPYSNTLLSDADGLKTAIETTRDLATSLNFVDPTVIGLFRCAGYFHSQDPDNPRFGLVYDVPFPISNGKPQTLKDLLTATDNTGHRYMAMHALDKRIALARRLASALYFIHAVGWVHKSIRSSNILMLEPSTLAPSEVFPHDLGHPYLVSFESARADTAGTDLTMAEIEDQWYLNVYRHPSRQGTQLSMRFTMAHDVYSLGVVLLEIGLWRPFEKYEKELKGQGPIGMRDQLLKLAQGLAVNVGSKYQNLVVWCLSLPDGNLGETSNIDRVLETLEEVNL